jgi:hypothetical protein
MVLPFKFRRAISIAIPLFSALLFFGLFKNMLDIDLSTNIANTGITVGIIFGILNIFLLILVNKHQVP